MREKTLTGGNKNFWKKEEITLRKKECIHLIDKLKKSTCFFDENTREGYRSFAISL